MGKQIDFLNGTHRYYNRDNSSWVLVEMLYRWFTCDVRRINVMDLTSVMLQGSDAYIQYYRCVNSRKRLLHASVAQRRKYIYKCMKLLKQPCESGKVFIIKTIRLEMASVELLLTWLPGLKVIHLLRDPRGKLSSEFNVEPRMEWPSISSRADSVCRQMHSDIIEADRLYKLFPQSIRILQYELFASDTIRKARKLFMFLNLTFTIEMNKYVRTHTLQKDLHDNCFWCAKKTNARLTSVRWRLHMSHKDVQQVDQNCRTLYKTAGYLEIKDEKVLRNLSVPSQVDSWIKYMSL
ncbi:Carbohydrate sulfotransferase 5 [Mizuhopecten yessoensis]|uniref:Carbohydrate sulfotransferase 5 n=2 Tax=Mizuhopecten yessoensis TaxID=6573 RepID=A0A210R3S7_MIZYE|nr:Carbohydrate sulfotransferase 5 [Mizuhopecten yessoensis]